MRHAAHSWLTNLSKSEFQKEILLFLIIALNRDAVSCPIAQHFPSKALLLKKSRRGTCLIPLRAILTVHGSGAHRQIPMRQMLGLLIQ